MPNLWKWVIPFIAVPFIELVILFEIANIIGSLETLLLILITGIVGGMLAKREGINAWIRFQREVRSGSVPAGRIFDGFLILIGGALLLTPGLITDAIGFSLLIPPSRKTIKKLLAKYIRKKIEQGSIHVEVFGPA